LNHISVNLLQWQAVSEPHLPFGNAHVPFLGI
jgi:hypothetical protein